MPRISKAAQAAKDLARQEKEEQLQIELSNLYAPQSRYTPEEKLRAVMIYVTTGTIKKAAKLAGIPQQTLSDWKNKAVWWDDTVRECRKKKQDELDAMYTNVIHDIVEQVADRVKNGDTKVDKNGNQFKVPMGGKDLAVTMAVTFDKRQLLRGEATTRVEKVSEKDRLDRLADKFKEMSQKMRDSGMDTKIIDAEIIRGDEEEND